MTTEELLWNAAYEHDQDDLADSYCYKEEWRKECYYEDKERFDRLTELFRQAS